MSRLSVITLALNEEHNIVECLKSVSWADQIIVADSGSTDKTVPLARQFTNDVLELQWKGYGGTRNEALKHATGDWILWLDADERVTPELADEIQQRVRENDSAFAGYDVARRAYFLGKWIKHCGWYPSRVTRVFRKANGKFSESNVHEQLLLDGTLGHLRNDLLHYTDPDLHHYFHKFNRYTSLAAQDLHAGREKILSLRCTSPPAIHVYEDVHSSTRFSRWDSRVYSLRCIDGVCVCEVREVMGIGKQASICHGVKMTAQEKHQALFMQLIIMFHTLTMHQLGKVKNPVTDKIERDLVAAQGTIDMLDMLKEKTKGNLAPEEDRFLTTLLQEVKLNYVDEAAKPSEQNTKSNPPPSGEGSQAT